MLFRFGIVLVTFLMSSFQALAADITLRPDLKPYLRSLNPVYGQWAPVFDGGREEFYGQDIHVIKYSGPVESGDAEKLEDLVNSLPGYPFFFVVFDSPGGLFYEGIKIGKFLQGFRGGQDTSPLVGTIVLKDDYCMSACAIALTMAAAGEDAGSSTRYVEVGSELGFHMPFLSEEYANELEAIKDSMNLTYDLVIEYSKIISGGISPVELLQMSLYHRDSSSFFSLNGGLLTRYMGFAPVARDALAYPLFASDLSMDHVKALCGNLHFTRSDQRLNWQDIEAFDMDFGKHERWPDGTTLKEATELLRSPRLLSHLCAVEVRSDNSVGIESWDNTADGCAGSVPEGDWCPAELDEYSDKLPDATVGQLANIFDCNMGKLAKEFHFWSFPLAFDQEETGFEGSRLEQKTEVAHSANLRSAPDLNASVVGELNAGSVVAIRDCQIEKDSQGVWTQVETKNGTGWISSRYLYDGYNIRSLRRVAR